MRKLTVALGALGLIAGGWTLLWFAAANETTRQLDSALARERERGRAWTCVNKTVAGFPFAITVSCDRLDVSGRVFADSTQGSIAGLAIRVGFPNPLRATAALASPFTYRTADGQADLSIAWTRMTLDLDNLVATAKTATVTGSDLMLRGQFGAMGRQVVGATNAALGISNVADSLSPTADFALSIKGVDVAVLDQLIGDRKPADLAFAGRVDHAVFQDATSPEMLIERWRLAGGIIHFSTIRIERDASSVEARGPLRLDDLHRLSGDLDSTFTGAAPILRRYGINPNIAAAGSILNSLFGRHRDTDKPKALDANSLTLPIKFSDGRLGIGPIQLPVALPPLY